MDERDPQTYAVIGAAIRVHNELGCGFLEAVYREALRVEFTMQDITCHPEARLPLSYRGTPLKTFYRSDFICFDRIIVEVKSVREVGGIEASQVINYLKASHLETGLLLNFGRPRLEYRRFIQDRITSVSSVSSVESLPEP